MSHRIDIGGRQGRGNPKLGLGEDGALIDLDITKPAEHTLLRIGYVLSGLAVIALIVSCIDGVVL